MLPPRPSPATGPIGKALFRLAVVLCLFTAVPLCGAVGGSISGTVADPSGAVIPGATLRLVNTAQQTIYQAVSDRQGFYSFPNLPVGHYDLTISAPDSRHNERRI